MKANGHNNGRAASLVVEQMLNELQQTGEMTVDDVLCEFVDRANRGEPVDKEELLKQVPSEMRVGLAEELDFAQGMLVLGKTYRDAKKAGAAAS